MTATSAHPTMEQEIGDDEVLSLQAKIAEFHQRGNIEELNEAISRTRHALNAIHKGHPGLADLLSDLSYMLGERFKQTQRFEDLEEALWKIIRAIQATPEGHPGLIKRQNHFSDLANMDQSSPWQYPMGVPFIRLASIGQAVRFLRKQEDQYQARAISKQAVNFLPIAKHCPLTCNDQLNAVLVLGDAADGGSPSLKAGGDVIEALELLEHHSGTIIGYLIDAKSDIMELESPDS